MTMLVATVASAGLNAGGTARIYWLPTTGSTVPVPSRDATGDAMIGLVTAKGITNFRGADVQIVVNAFDQSGLPGAWQTGAWAVTKGGFKTGTSTVFTNIFSAVTALPGQAMGQDGSLQFQNPVSCVTPHDVGVSWFSLAGSTAVGRIITREYGVIGFTMDVDPAGAGYGKAVCINPNWRLPCGSGEKGNVLVVVDNNSAKDYLAFENGYQFLTYMADAGAPGCPTSTPVGKTTWGHVRNLYK